MNVHREFAIRNFPKPKVAVVYADCGLSERTAVVARICERTNEVLEYYMGLDASKLAVPAQSNVDERMPLTFLRPCCDAINYLIEIGAFPIKKVPTPTDNMDYHAFVPLTRQMAEALNDIIELL